MSKHRPNINQEFKKSLGCMNLDELHSLITYLGERHTLISRDYRESISRMDTVRQEKTLRKNNGMIGISDHAVLRYLERHKGVDVTAVRREIQAMVPARQLILGTDGHYDLGNGVIAAMPQGGVMATILPKTL